MADNCSAEARAKNRAPNSLHRKADLRAGSSPMKGELRTKSRRGVTLAGGVRQARHLRLGFRKNRKLFSHR